VKVILSLFRKIYSIEYDLRERGVSFDQRRVERQQKSAPLFEKLKTFLEANATLSTQSWKQAVTMR